MPVKKSSINVSQQNSGQKPLSDREVQLALIENFVSLQKVLTNLSIKFDSLSDNISRLLQLFEISAKSFIKKTEEGNPEENDLLRKLDTLLEQNKTVAKGVTLMEEKIRHKLYGESNRDHNPSHTESEMHNSTAFGEKPRPKPLPRI